MSLSIAAPPVPLRSLVRYLADENFNVHIVNGVLSSTLYIFGLHIGQRSQVGLPES